MSTPWSSPRIAAELSHWSTWLIIGLVLFFSLATRSQVEMLSLARPPVFAGEWWRVFTSQIVHLSVNHAGLNAAGFFIVSYSFKQDVSPLREIVALLFSMLAVGLGILYLNPEILWYVGLSGAIYGVLVHHLIVGSRRTPVISCGFLLFVVSKVIYEQWFAGPDRAIESFIGGQVAEDAHLYGTLMGIPLGIASFFLHDRTRAN